jgi:hypothetical protein
MHGDLTTRARAQAACVAKDTRDLLLELVDSLERLTSERDEWHRLHQNAQAALRCDHKFVDSRLCLKCGWTPEGSR